MENELVKYYQDLSFEPSPNRSWAINKITQHIPFPVTQEKNEALLRPIKEMLVGKSSEPDNFTTDFFHHCWHMVCEEVWKLVEDSRISGGVLSTLNKKFLNLILKEE